MKTIEEFIKEIDGSPELQHEANSIGGTDGFADLLKKYDVSGTAGDFNKALMAKHLNLTDGEGELGDDDVEAVAGGGILCDWFEWC